MLVDAEELQRRIDDPQRIPGSGPYLTIEELQVSIIHQAVLSERERCAKLAETIATQYDPKGWDGEADSYQTANLIAAEIRKGE